MIARGLCNAALCVRFLHPWTFYSRVRHGQHACDTKVLKALMEVPTLESGRCGRRRRLRMQRAPTTHSICALKVVEEGHGKQGRRGNNLIFTTFATSATVTVVVRSAL